MSPKSVKKASSKPLQKKASKKVEKVTEKCAHRRPSGLQNRLKLLPGASPKHSFLQKLSQRCPKRLPGASAGASGTPNRRKKSQKTTKKLLENHAENIHACCKILQKLYRKFTHTCFAARCCAKFFLARRTGRKPTWITTLFVCTLLVTP